MAPAWSLLQRSRNTDRRRRPGFLRVTRHDELWHSAIQSTWLVPSNQSPPRSSATSCSKPWVRQLLRWPRLLIGVACTSLMAAPSAAPDRETAEPGRAGGDHRAGVPHLAPITLATRRRSRSTVAQTRRHRVTAHATSTSRIPLGQRQEKSWRQTEQDGASARDKPVVKRTPTPRSCQLRRGSQTPPSSAGLARSARGWNSSERPRRRSNVYSNGSSRRLARRCCNSRLRSRFLHSSRPRS